MTAFTRQTNQSADGTLTWEIRTVNHRFLDLSIRTPECLRHLEQDLRQQISQKILRGKVEATLRLGTGNKTSPHFVINEKLLEQLATACSKVAVYFPNVQNNALAILNWPGVIVEAELEQSQAVETEVLTLLDNALEDVLQMRRKEGKRIQQFILEKIDTINNIVKNINAEIPQLLAAERERLQKRLTDIQSEGNPLRLEQEMLLIIQKTDVAEEIQRLESHCLSMREVLSHPGASGRRLDFLSQEMHREANTLSNKALSTSLVNASVEMRVLIEQIREQVQNIE